MGGVLTFLGVLMVLIVIAAIAPIVSLLKKRDYKNLAVYSIALWLFLNSNSILISIASLVVLVVVGFRATK